LKKKSEGTINVSIEITKELNRRIEEYYQEKGFNSKAAFIKYCIMTELEKPKYPEDFLR
jgi:metal-responsive CopG/Arc/MetJ family transcriptional regulator